MRVDDPEATEPEAISQRGSLSRKRFLGVAAASSAAFVAACGGGDTEGTAPAAASNGADLPGDAPRGLKVVWALAALDTWNIPIDVGFNDAARLVGWKYEKVGLPISQYSPENVVKVINQAIQTRPDVLVTPAWVPGVYDAAAEGKEKGILVILNNADNYPDKARKFGLPYVGGDGRREGVDLGTALLQQVRDGGKRSGAILAGNLYPGNKNIEDRLGGIEEAIGAFNEQHGTDFEYVEFNDLASDSAKGVAQYKAKMTQIGPTLVGIVGMSSAAATYQRQALLQRGKQAGEIPVACWANDAQVAKLLESGWVTVNLDNNYHFEGFLPVMLAWQEKARGLEATGSYMSGYSIDTKETLQQALDRWAGIDSLAKAYGVKIG
jgi:ABC-type sugar transport system substrate-binding protein